MALVVSGALMQRISVLICGGQAQAARQMETDEVAAACAMATRSKRRDGTL